MEVLGSTDGSSVAGSDSVVEKRRDWMYPREISAGVARFRIVLNADEGLKVDDDNDATSVMEAAMLSFIFLMRRVSLLLLLLCVGFA